MDYKDYYKTLGVDKNTDQDQIKKAFRKLARQYHPDLNPDDKNAEDKFKEINEAYEVLSDPEKRKKYDQFGSQWQQYSRAGGRPEDFDWARWTTQPGGNNYSSNINLEELEQMFGGGFGGFSSFFETLFGGGGRPSGGFGRQPYQTRTQRPQRGQDSEHTVSITLEEAFHGTKRVLQWENGRRIEASVPKGVRNGSKVRLKGQGQKGAGGGKTGDLYLKVKVHPHSKFTHERDNLRTTIPVDLYTALLGGEVEVQAIDRKVKLTIPPETANGKVFKLGGLGMSNLRNPDKHGDLFAKVEITLPSELSKEEKKLIKQLQKLRT